MMIAHSHSIHRARPHGSWLVLYAVISIGCGHVKSPGNLDPVDAEPGDTPDADPSVKYEVGYIDELTLPQNVSSIYGFLLIVNGGGVPLNTSAISIVSVTDDNPGIDWALTKSNDATRALPVGRAAGSLSTMARARIVDSGLVTETIDDPFLNFGMGFTTQPLAGTTLNAQAVIRIDGKEAALPFLIHIGPSGSAVALSSARRIRSQP